MNSLLADIPEELPILLRARRITEKAATVGFDWPDIGGVWDKIAEEIGELQEAVDLQQGRERIEAELGDLLMAITNLSRFLGVDPERALQQATARFTSRFRAMEELLAATGRRMEDEDLDALEALWQQAKREEKP